MGVNLSLNKSEHGVQSYAAGFDCLDYKILRNANDKQCQEMLMLSNANANAKQSEIL